MFDFGLSTSHVLVIVVLAVIAIGPKDLPVVLRRFGQFMNKMRGMAREFQGHVDAAMKDAGMEDVQKDLANLKSGLSTAINPVQSVMTSALTSAVATPSASNITGNATSGSSLPQLQTTTGSDFSRHFVAGGVGETRVQGRAWGETEA